MVVEGTEVAADQRRPEVVQGVAQLVGHVRHVAGELAEQLEVEQMAAGQGQEGVPERLLGRHPVARVVREEAAEEVLEEEALEDGESEGRELVQAAPQDLLEGVGDEVLVDLVEVACRARVGDDGNAVCDGVEEFQPLLVILSFFSV